MAEDISTFDKLNSFRSVHKSLNDALYPSLFYCALLSSLQALESAFSWPWVISIVLAYWSACHRGHSLT